MSVQAPYAQGLRARAIELRDEGLTRERVAELLDVNPSTLSNWCRWGPGRKLGLSDSDPAVVREVRRRLELARERGASFEAAWRAALPEDEEWREALRATRSAWEDAYERRPGACWAPLLEQFEDLGLSEDVTAA